jgi:biotin carboxyl carrier protein
MEFVIRAPASAVVRSVAVKPGQTVRAGDVVMALEEA